MLIPPLPGQLQQQHEEVDEIEIQGESAHQRLFGEYVAWIARQINLLIRCVSQAVRPEKIRTDRIDRAN